MGVCRKEVYFFFFFFPISEESLERKYEVKKTGKAGLLAPCQTLKTTPFFAKTIL